MSDRRAITAAAHLPDGDGPGAVVEDWMHLGLVEVMRVCSRPGNGEAVRGRSPAGRARRRVAGPATVDEDNEAGGAPLRRDGAFTPPHVRHVSLCRLINLETPSVRALGVVALVAQKARLFPVLTQTHMPNRPRPTPTPATPRNVSTLPTKKPRPSSNGLAPPAKGR